MKVCILKTMDYNAMYSLLGSEKVNSLIST